jgi:hypothetical protein
MQFSYSAIADFHTAILTAIDDARNVLFLQGREPAEKILICDASSP